MKRRPPLGVTLLEDRLTPAGFGNAWVETNLTVSYAPDGTDVAGAASTLFRSLAARATPVEWQTAVAAALQAWVAPANLNVAVVADDGRAFGTPGPVQGCTRVGDIRIAARPLSDNVLAITNPFDLISPWAGEIVLNSNKTFDTHGSPAAYDLKTVLLQEVGHALGVANSPDPNSVMYENYRGPRAGLSAGDVAAVQALYGARAADRFDANDGNETLTTSTRLSYIQSPTQLAGTDGTAGAHPFVALGDIHDEGDVDVYEFDTPKRLNAPTVVVQTGGLSSARLQVSVIYQRSGEPGHVSHVLAQTSTPNAAGDFVIPFTPPAGAKSYYVRVEPAPGAGSFAVGSYRLAMGDGLTAIPTSTYTTVISTPGGTVTESADWAAGQPANDSRATATKLGLAWQGGDARWDYSGVATFGSAADVDVYRVRTTATSGGVMVVSVDTPPGGVDPVVGVSDAKGHPVSTQALLRNGDVTIIQVRGVKPDSEYYVSVRAARPEEWAGAESYRLGIDFRTTPVSLDPVASGTLTAAQPQLLRELEVTRSEQFRFQLSAASTTDTAPTAARLTIFDASGAAVLTLVAENGQTVIGDVLLAPGRYTVVVVGATIDGSPLLGLQIDAQFLALTDPIGPALGDDYSSPTPTATPTDTTVPTSPTEAPDSGFVWISTAAVGWGFLAPTDPYSAPWW